MKRMLVVAVVALAVLLGSTKSLIADCPAGCQLCPSEKGTQIYIFVDKSGNPVACPTPSYISKGHTIQWVNRTPYDVTLTCNGLLKGDLAIKAQFGAACPTLTSDYATAQSGQQYPYQITIAKTGGKGGGVIIEY